MKYVVFLGDGMADTPNENLGGKTPLELAKKHNIDNMAKYAKVFGMAKTVPDTLKPGSDVANLSAMGYNPLDCYTGRSPLEAVSVGVPLNDDDITFRVNLVTLSDDEKYENKEMIDYSSDEITTPEAHELIKTVADKLNTEILNFYPGFSYRHILVWKGGKLNFNLTPPHDISGRKVTDYLPKGENADVLEDLMRKSVEILKNHPVNLKRIERGLRPATSIWIWGEGSKAKIPNFKEMHNLSGGVISAVDLVKGIGLSAGMECPDIEGATGNIHTNFDAKAKASIELLKKHDYVYIHLEAPDECGHRGEYENKVRSIELIDEKIVAPLLKYLEGANEPFKALVMPDHPTPLDIKTHSRDAVPFFIYDSECKTESGITTYTEKECEKSGLYIEKAHEITNLLIK